jgi:hypothetical protein
MTDIPLIYTKFGNLPIADLDYYCEWSETPDYVKFREWYLDKSGETVRESAHVLSRHGVAGDGVAAEI